MYIKKTGGAGVSEADARCCSSGWLVLRSALPLTRRAHSRFRARGGKRLRLDVHPVGVRVGGAQVCLDPPDRLVHLLRRGAGDEAHTSRPMVLETRNPATLISSRPMAMDAMPSRYGLLNRCPRKMPRNANTRPSMAAKSSSTTVYRLGSLDLLMNCRELTLPLAARNCLVAMVKEAPSMSIARPRTMYAAVGSPISTFGATCSMWVMPS